MFAKKIPAIVKVLQWTGNNTKEVLTFLDNSSAKEHGIKNSETIYLVNVFDTYPIYIAKGCWVIKVEYGRIDVSGPDRFKKEYEIIEENK